MAHLADPCMYCGADKRPDGTLVGWRQAGSPRAALDRGDFFIKQDVRQPGELVARLGGETLEILRKRRDVDLLEDLIRRNSLQLTCAEGDLTEVDLAP